MSLMQTGKRLVGEFVVIVVGVLVALAVDDVRTAREERSLERYYLESLASDLSTDTLRLRGLLAVGDTIQMAGERLGRYLGDPLRRSVRTGVQVSDGGLPLWLAVRKLGGELDFNPSAGAYGEIVASGNLRLLRVPTLRRALSAYYVAVANTEDRAAAMAGVSLEQYLLTMRDKGMLLVDVQADSTLVDRLRGDVGALANLRGAESRSSVLRAAHEGLFHQAEGILDLIEGL